MSSKAPSDEGELKIQFAEWAGRLPPSLPRLLGAKDEPGPCPICGNPNSTCTHASTTRSTS